MYHQRGDISCALRLVTQKLPSGRLGSSSRSNEGGGVITLKEEIARLIYFLSRMGGRVRMVMTTAAAAAYDD